MPRLEVLANVALRVPSILALDLLYKYDIEGLTEHLRLKNENMLAEYRWIVSHMFYIGHLLLIILLLLPLKHVVSVYLHVLAAMLLFVGHQMAKEFVLDELRSSHQGAPYLHSQAFSRFIRALTCQLLASGLCVFVMNTRRVWLFWPPALPLLARLGGAPVSSLPAVHAFAATLSEVACGLFLLSALYRIAKAAPAFNMEVMALSRLLPAAISLWSELAVPLLFGVFWGVLFVVRLSSGVMSPAARQGILFFLLSSVSECCATPYSLLGLTFAVSYLSVGLLNLCKLFLGSYDGVHNHDAMHRGVTEGVTLLLLALQTGLLGAATLQRTFLLAIILFIVLTSTLQATLDVTHPLVLALAASGNRSVWRHLRGLCMCLVLLVLPVFLAYKILQFFHMDAWLLILVAGCMLTSLQVTGTLFIYSLFMVEMLLGEPMDNLDEVIYWVNGVSRALEFALALCVVAYGAWETLLGEWSWTGASVMVLHSYCNVWLRAQSAWRGFLLRLEAVKKIQSLPRATPQQLRRHDDVCAICFMEMTTAVVTSCEHLFHAKCLSKWLHVQATCPMCHQTVPTQPPARPAPEPDAPAPPEEDHVDSEEEEPNHGAD